MPRIRPKATSTEIQCALRNLRLHPSLLSNRLTAGSPSLLESGLLGVQLLPLGQPYTAVAVDQRRDLAE